MCVCLFGLCGCVFSTISQVNTRNIKDAPGPPRKFLFASLTATSSVFRVVVVVVVVGIYEDDTFYCCCSFYKHSFLLLLLLWSIPEPIFQMIFSLFWHIDVCPFLFFHKFLQWIIKKFTCRKKVPSRFILFGIISLQIFWVILSSKWRKSWRPPEYLFPLFLIVFHLKVNLSYRCNKMSINRTNANKSCEAI